MCRFVRPALTGDLSNRLDLPRHKGSGGSGALEPPVVPEPPEAPGPDLDPGGGPRLRASRQQPDNADQEDREGGDDDRPQDREEGRPDPHSTSPAVFAIPTSAVIS